MPHDPHAANAMIEANRATENHRSPSYDLLLEKLAEKGWKLVKEDGPDARRDSLAQQDVVRARILSKIERNPGIPIAEIADTIGSPRPLTRRVVRELIEQGKIIVTEDEISRATIKVSDRRQIILDLSVAIEHLLSFDTMIAGIEHQRHLENLFERAVTELGLKPSRLDYAAICDAWCDGYIRAPGLTDEQAQHAAKDYASDHIGVKCPRSSDWCDGETCRSFTDCASAERKGIEVDLNKLAERRDPAWFKTPIDDTYGAVQAQVYGSSAAMYDAVWIKLAGEVHVKGPKFGSSEEPPKLRLHTKASELGGAALYLVDGSLSAHLDVERAIEVRDRLDAWLTSVGGQYKDEQELRDISLWLIAEARWERDQCLVSLGGLSYYLRHAAEAGVVISKGEPQRLVERAIKQANNPWSKAAVGGWTPEGLERWCDVGRERVSQFHIERCTPTSS